MKTHELDGDTLKRVAESLRTLREDLHDDLSAVQHVALEMEEAGCVRCEWRDLHSRTEALVRRIEELRDVIESRVRTLRRLRARMHQLRGGARPH